MLMYHNTSIYPFSNTVWYLCSKCATPSSHAVEYIWIVCAIHLLLFLMAISVKPWEDMITAFPTWVTEENITPVAFAIHCVSSDGQLLASLFRHNKCSKHLATGNDYWIPVMCWLTLCILYFLMKGRNWAQNPGRHRPKYTTCNCSTCMNRCHGEWGPLK